MGLFFRNRKHLSNSSDNNITLNTTSTDLIYNISKDVCEIKTQMILHNKEFKTILDDHEARLKKLEEQHKD